MNVDGGVGNVEMIGKHFPSFTFFRDVFLNIVISFSYSTTLW